MTEPTIEQLANFARVRVGSVVGFQPSQEAVLAMFEASPATVENWRRQHAAFQAEIDALCDWCGGSGDIEGESCLRCDGTGKKS